MAYSRLSETRIRADLASLGSIAAVARKYGVTFPAIRRRVPDPVYGRSPGIKDPLRRAAFLHSAGLTMDEVKALTGLGYCAIIQAVRARHASRQGA